MYRLRGQVRALDGWPGQWQEVAVHYDVTKDCPICAGVGTVAEGWFACEGARGAVALLSEGRVFVPVTVAEDSPHAS